MLPYVMQRSCALSLGVMPHTSNSEIRLHVDSYVRALVKI